jgi:serine/threonine-protein phosphatase PGAM5
MKVLVLCFLSVASLASAQAPTGNYPGRQPVDVMKGRGVHYLYLVRHGIYDRDTTVTDDRIGNGLNAQGHEQAKLIGARLAALPIKMTHLVSSEFRRAAETADDMAAYLKLTPSRDGSLNECTPSSSNPKVLTGLTPQEVASCDSTREVAWRKWLVPTPDRDTYDVLVCHGNVIRWTLMRALGADTKNWANQDSGNGSLTIIAVRPDGSTRLVMYSDVGHIPWGKQTWSGRGGGWVPLPR